jgi:ribosomal protein S18 acetylase RimI-like enzyme
MSRPDLRRYGADRLRVGPWRGDARVAYVAPAPDAPPPTVEAVRRCLEELAGAGYVEVVTGALAPGEQAAFATAGFEVRERLHLLAHDLADLPEQPPAPLRRARRMDRPAVLAVDARAFPPFWRLDDGGLNDAIEATPVARFRVSTADHEIVGYAICGRSGRRGYLQRLAVDPDHQGHGLGQALVVDGLRWMRRRGVSRAVVNTQHSNDHALELYERLGFRRQPAGLAVLAMRVAP